MCLPALPLIAGAVSAAGSLVQGYSALQQGKYESGVARMNAQMEREAGLESIKAGQVERRDYWRKISAVKGQQVAAMAANGIDVGYGSGVRVQQDTQMLADEDAQTLYKNIEERTKGHVVNAANFTAEAKAAKMRGKAAFVGSIFEAGSSLLGGFQQAKGLQAKVAPGSSAGTSYAPARYGYNPSNRGR